jgi:hypothetical protein
MLTPPRSRRASAAARPRHPSRDRRRAARAGRRRDRGGGPASRRARHHHAPAGHRRHAGGRLAHARGSGPCPRCGSATAAAAGTPPAWTASARGGSRLQPVDRYPHGHAVAEDHPPAGSARRLDRDIRRRAIGSGPGHRPAQPAEAITPRTGTGSPAPPAGPMARRHEQAASDDNRPTCHRTPTAGYLTSTGRPAPAP